MFPGMMQLNIAASTERGCQQKLNGKLHVKVDWENAFIRGEISQTLTESIGK